MIPAAELMRALQEHRPVFTRVHATIMMSVRCSCGFDPAQAARPGLLDQEELMAEHFASVLLAPSTPAPLAVPREPKPSRNVVAGQLADDGTIQLPAAVITNLAAKPGEFVYFVRRADGAYEMMSEAAMDAWWQSGEVYR